MQGISGVKLAG
jgi:intraflagellar transport protein 74